MPTEQSVVPVEKGNERRSAEPKLRDGRGGGAGSRVRERAAEARQSELFNRAAELFRESKFGMARRILEKVQAGPNASLAHRARIYIEICNQRMARKHPKLDTLEDRYNYAVILLNEGRFGDAVRVCNQALAADADAAQVHYLKAVAKILAGTPASAVAPLKKAIALDESIREQAQRDPDLASVMRKRPFAKLLAG